MTYEKGKIIFPMNLPNNEVCDSDHDNIVLKYGRQRRYGKLKAEVGKILRGFSERKGVEGLEKGRANLGQIQILLSISPKCSLL